MNGKDTAFKWNSGKKQETESPQYTVCNAWVWDKKQIDNENII
jgi:hypothetical protein